MKLFDHISEIADDTDCFVTVLVDEVESITAARASAARSNEPGDAVRVVNAVLTSLDALKRRPNVLVLCTSNMVDTIDPVSDENITYTRSMIYRYRYLNILQSLLSAPLQLNHTHQFDTCMLATN